MAEEVNPDVVGGSAEGPSLTPYSFDELLATVIEKHSRASAAATVAGWDNLREVIEALRGKSDVDDATSWILDQKWQLTSVSAAGFRGISNDPELSIAFDPRPGITVLHGANGAGKSSVADAVTASLTGLLPVDSGSGGNAPLWEPVAFGRDATEARTQVTLVSGGATLVLKSIQATPESEPSWECSLSRDGVTEPVELGDGWRNAIANYNPVFAYATIERKTQVASQLKRYFEDLLALGGAFERVSAEVADRGQASDIAYDAWKRARDLSSATVRDLDKQRFDAAQVNLPPLNFPAIGDSIDAWLRDNELELTGVERPELAPGFAAGLTRDALEASAALDALRKARENVGQSFADELEQLHKSAAHPEKNGGPCPVCLTVGVPWYATLTASVEALDALGKVKKAAVATVTALNAHCTGTLGNLLEYPPDPHHATATVAAHTEGRQKVEAFLAAVRAGGLQIIPTLEDATTKLVDWITSDGGAAVVLNAIAQSERSVQWRLQRRKAVEAFVETWREHREVGATKELWTETAKLAKELRESLRQRRTASLMAATSEKVNQLLADVGLEVQRIRVLQTKADFDLVDQSQRPVDLGMLSAGQRNAVLLAPLIASAEAGPFDFLFLDDPVHAFDELRVDHLAEVLGSLALTRRVVVLTHDERLREHLIALPGDFTSHLVARDALTGTVAVLDSTRPWQTLLQDARDVLGSGSPVPGTALTLTDTVRGFCRQSLDVAVRGFVIRNAVEAGRPYLADVQMLDEVNTTRERLDVAEALETKGTTKGTTVKDARSVIAPHLENWNRATHGNPPKSAATLEEIDAALNACRLLARD